MGFWTLLFVMFRFGDKNKDEASGEKKNLNSNNFQSTEETATTARPVLRESPRCLHKTEIEPANFIEAFVSLKSRNLVCGGFLI
jgi:hypothetical protein